MKATFYTAPNTLVTQDVEIPEIGENEMLIQIRAAAVCGTDLRIYKFGHFKITEGEKRVLGHELAGEIAQIGKNVKGFRVGMRVALPPNIGCGTCPMCLKGQNQLCPNYEAFGISLDGGFQEYMRVPAIAIERGNVIEIPDSLSFEEAAMCEPFSCTYNSWRALRTQPGDTVLIVGAGPIGACHVMINRLAGAAKVMVADVSPKRLEEIAKFGTDVTINSAQENLLDRVMEETKGEGASVVITACSVPEIQTQSLELAGRQGRINLFGGMPKGKEIVPLNTNLIHYKELKVLATTGSTIEDFYQSLQIASSGRVNLAGMATGRFSIEETEKAFAYAASGSGMKAVVLNEK